MSPDSAAAFSVEAEELPLLEPGADTVDAGADELQAAMEARLREIGEREAAIRERLLDIEASLTAIGVSGLPTAPRNPNRFQNPLAAGRLRSERRELQQELEALAVERGLLR